MKATGGGAQNLTFGLVELRIGRKAHTAFTSYTAKLNTNAFCLQTILFFWAAT